jgi:hypothetical protein
MPSSADLVGTLLARVDAILQSAGATRVPTPDLSGLAGTADGLVAVYEDTQSFVGVASYTSVAALREGWLQAQEDLALLTSSSIASLGAKAWDGYLVLLSTQAIPEREVAAVTAIRGNTRRLRKLVIAPSDETAAATPERLSNFLRRELAPLLPLDLPRDGTYQDPVKALPQRLKVPGMTATDITTVLDAYDAGSPMVVALHQQRLSAEAHS